MRLKYIDSAKGVCIALVVLGHICRGNWKGTIPIELIYTVNVQTFFIISGIFIEKKKEYLRDWKEILIINTKRLIVPYFFFETLYNIAYALVNGWETFRWQEIDTFIFYGRGIATWFLIALFAAKMIVIILYKAGKNKKLVLIIACLLFGISLCHGLILSTPHHWIVQIIFRILTGTGFLAIGIMLSCKLEGIINCKKIIVICAAAIVYFIITVMNGQVSTYKLEFNNPVFYVISSIIGSILLMWICNLHSCSVLEFLGHNSIIILGTHQAILCLLQAWLGKEYSIVVAAFLWIGIMLLEFPIIEAINRWMPFLVGKRIDKRKYSET